MENELPNYKPLVKRIKKGKDDRLKPLPFIENGNFYFDAVIAYGDPMIGQIAKWKSGELGDQSPDEWYYLCTSVASHKNKDKLANYFPNLQVPEEVEALYDCFWQLRLACSHPSTKELIRKAEYAWSWAAYLNTAIDY